MKEDILLPFELLQKLAVNANTKEFIKNSRYNIRNIIQKKDKRLLVITGPCSIHNISEAYEIAENLKKQQEKNPNLYIVMRTYFEKPRTQTGWKGLMNDPNLDNGCDLQKGIITCRKLLQEINRMGVPVAVEFLDLLTPLFLQDLIHWGAIGARTTESPEHRKLVSGLTIPIGFKNGMDGNIDVAVNAIFSAKDQHSFLWVNEYGRLSYIRTSGNPDTHVILRGGNTGTNFDNQSVSLCSEELKKNDIHSGILIDCSHGNTGKDYRKQEIVCKDISKQISQGNKDIIGVMIESNIYEGAQKFDSKRTKLIDMKRGISLSDSCVSLDTNERMLQGLEKAVIQRNNNI